MTDNIPTLGHSYTLAPAARREVLDRLLALNHQRHAEEFAAGLHDKKKPAGKRTAVKNYGRGAASPPTATQGELF